MIRIALEKNQVRPTPPNIFEERLNIKHESKDQLEEKKMPTIIPKVRQTNLT